MGRRRSDPLKHEMNLPTVKQLRYLVALDEYRHFGKAARACFVSQSAFSVAIKELESVLDARLVDRSSKSVALTLEGSHVARRARVWLRELENLVEHSDPHKKPLSGPLNLGVIPTIAPFLLPGLLPNLRRNFPELKLYLKERITPMLYDELLAGQIDLMLIALPYELKQVETMPLFNDAFLLACRDDTRWLDPAHFSIDRLAAESVLLLEDGHCLRDHALSACRLRNLDTVNRFAATSLLTLLHMIDNDLGVTFIPEMAETSPLMRDTRIRSFRLAEDSYRTIGLAWRKNSAKAQEFEMLGRFIQENHQCPATSLVE